MWLSLSISFSIASQKSLLRKEVMISRCETSLILVSSYGFSSKLFFQLLILFITSISILRFWATSSFQVRTEPGSLWSSSLLLGWWGSSWWMSVLPGQPRMLSLLHSQQRMRDQGCSPCPCRVQLHCWMQLFLKLLFSLIPIVSLPYLYSHVCQQTDCCVFSTAVIPAAIGALLHDAMWHCSACFYLQCLINM